MSGEKRVASGECLAERPSARRPLRSYRDLLAWQKAMDLLESVYHITRGMPPPEAFGLIAQLQRAVVSIPGNIAEGQGRLHRGDFIHHLSIARGSLLEVETYLIAVVRLRYAQTADIQPTLALCDEVSRLLAGLMKSLGEVRLHRSRR